MNFASRILLSILALVVFATSSCFAFGVHMCEGEVQSQAFFSQAQACEKMADMNKEDLPECCKKIRDEKISNSSSKLLFKKKACCYNHYFEFKSDQNQDGENVSISLTNVVIDLPIQFDSEVLFSSLDNAVIPHFRGPPDPHIRRDIHSLYQVFII